MKKLLGVIGRGIGIATVLAVGSQIPAEADGLPGTTLEASGTTVLVKLVQSYAGYTSDIQFFATVGGVTTLFSNKDLPGTEHTLTVPAGQEVIFGIYVRNTDMTYYIGSGSRNLDGLVHANVEALEDGWYRIGFEDLSGGGDGDFNDVIFDVHGVSAMVNPEPVTMVLLGSGLLGLGGAAARRRQKGELG